MSKIATNQTHAKSEYDANPSGIVVGLTISMSWQPALAVLVPVLIGRALDTRWHPNGAPYFTLAGLCLGLAGMFIVVRRTLKLLNKYMQKSLQEPNGDKHS